MTGLVKIVRFMNGGVVLVIFFIGIELILAFMNQEVMCCTCVYTNLER